jgi:hypothetical protein
MNETEGTEEPDVFGLDKEAWLRAKRGREQEEERRPEPLDLPYPYRVISFDPVMMGRTALTTLRGG